MTIIQSILPIIVSLIAGYGLGKLLPQRANTLLIRLIGPLVWLLLFLIGSEFGEVISTAESAGRVLGTSLSFAVLATVIPGALIFATRPRSLRKATGRQGFRWTHLWHPLRECVVAVAMVALGCGFHLANKALFDGGVSLPTSSTFLLVLIVLVGVDLAETKLGSQWFTWRNLSIPVLVVAGSILAGLIASLATGESLRTSLALTSGYGWFSLSSVLVGDELGQTYGTMALMIDLARELLAIVILYALGSSHPHAGIGSAGATALDSTLPIIKQACSPEAVPTAMVSGLILTVLAPIAITTALA